MNDLTERYLFAVSEHLPADVRDDVTDELRTMITDMAEERGGDTSVRDVLVELGDPATLARSYAGPARHLIGPVVYGEYVGLLKTLAAYAIPGILLLFVMLELSDPDRPVVTAVLSALGSTLEIATHMFFWVTVTFAAIERFGDPVSLVRGESHAWQPERLPALPTVRQIGLGDTVGAAVVLLAALVLLPWQHYRSAFDDAEGNAIPLLNPDLWSFWLPLFVVVVLVTLAVEVWKYRTGRWTLPLVLVNLVVDGLLLGYLITLRQTEEMINPRWTAAMRESGADFDPDIGTSSVVLVAAVVVSWDILDSLVKHVQLRRTAQRGDVLSAPART